MNQDPMDVFRIFALIFLLFMIVCIGIVINSFRIEHNLLKKYNVRSIDELLDKYGVKNTAKITGYHIYNNGDPCATLEFVPIGNAVPIRVFYHLGISIPYYITIQPIKKKYPVGSTIEIIYCPDYPKIYRTTTKLTNRRKFTHV